MATIIVSSPLPGPDLDRLKPGNNVIIGTNPGGLGSNGLIDCLHNSPDTSAIVSLLSDRIDSRVLDACQSVKIIASYAVGVDNIDLDLCSKRGIVVTNTPGVLTEATADLAMALMLDACRSVSRGDRFVRAGEWKGWVPNLFLGPRVTGATLGLIGFGRIGQAVAKRAAGFGMHVLYHQRHRVDDQLERATNSCFASLDDLLALSDIVSLHCPLTDETRGMLNEDRMRKMRRGTVLINTARGACVDEGALTRLLETEHIAAAGLDVYEREPFLHPSLISLPNVVLAPHLGSADIPTRRKMTEMCVDAVLDVLGGRCPTNRVV